MDNWLPLSYLVITVGNANLIIMIYLYILKTFIMLHQIVWNILFVLKRGIKNWKLWQNAWKKFTKNLIERYCGAPTEGKRNGTDGLYSVSGLFEMTLILEVGWPVKKLWEGIDRKEGFLGFDCKCQLTLSGWLTVNYWMDQSVSHFS